MNKYAFIQNVPGLSVQPYELSFDDGEWLSHVAGFDGIDKCMDYAKKLIADGARGNIVIILPDRGDRYFTKNLYE